jgi:hypothetical protein
MSNFSHFPTVIIISQCLHLMLFGQRRIKTKISQRHNVTLQLFFLGLLYLYFILY